MNVIRHFKNSCYRLLLLSLLLQNRSWAQDLQLSTTQATLTLSKQKGLVIRPKAGTDLAVEAPLASLWKLTVQDKKESTDLSPKLLDVNPSAEVDVKQSGNEILLTYTALQAGSRPVPVRAELRISTRDDTFQFTGTVASTSDDFSIREFTYPILPSIKTSAETKVYLPNGLGQCFTDLKTLGRQSLDYPSGRATMQWLSINRAGGPTSTGGLYVGCHDGARTKKQFDVSYNGPAAELATSVTFPVFSQSFAIPPVVVAPYLGNWHVAAKRYRAWYDTQFKLPTIPAWVKGDTGWLLAILKQQNGYVMWRYDELDKLCDIAERFGLTTIGLFGWANGGHDYLYPNYIPDDLMGGRRALKPAIERAHKRGIKIILYANGTVMDTGTEYYRYNGNETMIIKEDKSPYPEPIRKYNSATPVMFVQGSYSSPLWRKTMLDLALQANELGADGILYDQIGVKGAFLNFSKLQDHTLPQESGTKYRYQMLSEIRTAMKKLNPNFIIMTEATNDGVITDIDYHHGWGIGAALEPIGFGPSAWQTTYPALYRYVFPELVKTQRNANPMITRAEANFAAMYGLRHEIESRYAEDVAYLTKGRMPTADSYSDVAYYPPIPAKINEAPADVATKYVRDLIAFEQANKAFFREGKFVDEEGIQVGGTGPAFRDIIAKGFLNGNQLGVVVWNTNSTAERTADIKVPGYQLTEAKEPAAAKAEAGAPLNPNSIRLLIFKKDKNL